MSSSEQEGGTWQSASYHQMARTRTLALTEPGPVQLTEIEPRGRLLPHAHPQATLYFCLAGEGELSLTSAARPIRPDDHWIVPANGLHAVVNRADGVLRLLIIPVTPPASPAPRRLGRWRQWLPGG